MSEVEIRVKSPIKATVHSLEANTEDTVELVKQYVQSLSVLTQPVSAFQLAYKGEKLANDLTLGDLDPKAPSFEFDMLLGELTFIDVTLQIDQLREAFGLGSSGTTYVNAGATRLHEIKKGSKKGKKLSEDDIIDLAVLPESLSLVESNEQTPTSGSTSGIITEDISHFVSRPNPLIPKPSAIELKLSHWQALCRSPQVKLQGILAFVSLVSNDGKEWGFVATPKGFSYVPGLTERNLVLPSPSAQPLPTLLQAIEQVTPSTINLAHKNSEKIKANPLSCVSIPQVSSVAPWLVGDVPPITNSSINGLEIAAETSLRDWNEDFQSTREVIPDSFGERITRDRSLCLTAAEFASAATEGAVKIIEGGIAALNPDDDETGRLYLHKGIFYTHGADFQHSYAGISSENDAKKAVKKGINGVEQLMVLNDPQLCPVLTAVIDYCGRRLIAQAPVPGIFREVPLILYGQAEDPEVVLFDEEVDKSMQKFANSLHLKPHPVTSDGIQLQTSVEVHGARSTDGRLYATDLHRMQVPDLLFEGGELDLLRGEAVADFYAKNPDAEPLNPDVWMPTERLPQEYVSSQLPKDIDAVKAVGKHVREVLVPSLVKEVVDGTGVDPIDGIHLTDLMHRKGINMRHLGRVYTLACEANLKNLSAVAFEEALARSLKAALIGQLSKVNNTLEMSPIIQSFVSDFRLNQDSSIVSSVENRITSHFGFSTLPENWKSTFLPRITLLRLLSLKTGLQWNEKLELVAVNPIVRYSLPRSLTASDAIEAARMSLQAAFKNSEATGTDSQSADRQENVDDGGNDETTDDGSDNTDEPKGGSNDEEKGTKAGQTGESSDELMEQTLTVLSQAAGIYTQIYGPAHAEVAHILNQVATLYYEYGNDTKRAIEYSRKAITIAERVNGIDSYDAIVMYNNLAHFERTAGNFEATIELVKRITSMLDRLAWPGFSERSNAFATIAVMLLQSKKKKLQTASLEWFARAIALAKEAPTGPSGLLWFQYAQAQLLQEDYQNAARSMEASYQVFKKKHGADDYSAKEVKGYLEQLLKVTVSTAQSAKRASTLSALHQADLSASQSKRASGEKSKRRGAGAQNSASTGKHGQAGQTESSASSKKSRSKSSKKKNKSSAA